MTIYRGGPIVGKTVYIVANPAEVQSVEIYENATQVHLIQRGGFSRTNFILWPTVLTVTEFKDLFNPNNITGTAGQALDPSGTGGKMSLGSSRFDLTLAEDRPVGTLYINMMTYYQGAFFGVAANIYVNVTQVCRARTIGS
jgi:hypothetical protein